MEVFNRRFNAYLESWMGPRDHRVRGWLLLDNYCWTLALTVTYLVIVLAGPRYMRSRQAYSCRGLLVLYNLALTLLSFYMFYQLVTAVWFGGYNFYCQGTHSSQEADDKIIQALWWYYFSKLIEFMDTVFFILRKNNHQITFLHIYHHASMPNIWWFVMNWVPCGHTYFGACLNCFVHVVMYSYYGLSAIPAVRPYLWWKKYITQFQLIQFFLTLLQTTLAVRWPCGIPMGWLYFQIGYMVTLIIFFSNFYLQTYSKHSVSLKKDQQNGSSANGHTNGTSSQELAARRKLRVD
ncbi:very long chain fatty acid elongase 5 [Aulostomus maculatus]